MILYWQWDHSIRKPHTWSHFYKRYHLFSVYKYHPLILKLANYLKFNELIYSFHSSFDRFHTTLSLRPSWVFSLMKLRPPQSLHLLNYSRPLSLMLTTSSQRLHLMPLRVLKSLKEMKVPEPSRRSPLVKVSF